jgi:hypothetical protein
MRLRRLVAMTFVAALSVSAPGPGNAKAPIPHCRTPQLWLAPTFYGVGLGQFLQTFTFTNASAHACWLRGWPEFALEGRSGAPIVVRTRRVRQGNPSAPAYRTVVLRPRGAASFNVYGEDWDHLANKACANTTRVLVTPPHTHSALSVAVRLPDCGSFYIAPVIAGKRDRDAWSVVWNG